MSMLCFLSAVFIGKSFGQAAMNDTSAYPQKAVAQIANNYNKAIGQQSRLYDGHEYLAYDPHIKGTALFPYDAIVMAPGEINYDGIMYKDVPLLYDVYKDQVVSMLYNKFSMYAFLGTKVHDFTFSGHHFVRVNVDSLVKNPSGITTGFYDQLYGGKIEALARRSKSIQSSSTTTANIETYFVAKDEYFFRKGNTYYKVSGQGAVLDVLKDKKNELQQYIRQNNIKFRRDPEGAMAKIAAYYDQITN
jgi:hypothetical protein